ncbi:hypothetical protein IL972_16695 [Acinetobacter sp. FL51]|jgi:hypothetical protein|uniref:hypothetical protein n=1 Tax=Acinetobacter sp. FL51 TaxID=2777978 RepID=UPI0018E117A7|nr:hypothetical protein [Acinetobacter sp. FL51]MBI1453539.1 hypothetical protein [Acinetobacter sp. FL51]
MHTLHPYKISVFDIKSGILNQRYAPLGSIKGKIDAFTYIENWIRAKQAQQLIIDDTNKTSLLFRDFIFDIATRTIYGWVCVGDYGQANPILDIYTGQTAYEKKEHNAELVPHFLYLRLPYNQNKGLALFHGVRGRGVKSIFVEALNNDFKTNHDRVFAFSTLAYDKAISVWQDAITKEITAVPKVLASDIADKVTEITPDARTVITIKPPRLGNFGTWSNFRKKGSLQYDLLEVLEENYQDIRTVIEKNGKKKKLRIGTNITDDICVIEAPEELDILGGNPTLEGILDWCIDIEKDFDLTLDEPEEGSTS